MGSCIVLIAAVLSVTTLFISGNIDSGLVGLVLSYAISATGSLNWVIRSAGDGEYEEFIQKCDEANISSSGTEHSFC